MAIVDKYVKLFDDAESKISEILENTTSDFRSATKVAERIIGKNLLFSFIASLVLLAAAIGGYLYVQNYRDGTMIAEAKAVEALAEERSKFEAEIVATKKQIEQNAIESYKQSYSYREDACKLVASNISRIDYLHYMYVYINSDDIKKYPQVKSFYNNFLAEGHKEYKRKYK